MSDKLKCVDAECCIITFYDDKQNRRCPVCGVVIPE